MGVQLAKLLPGVSAIFGLYGLAASFQGFALLRPATSFPTRSTSLSYPFPFLERVLFVLTNASKIGPREVPSGYEFSEVADPLVVDEQLVTAQNPASAAGVALAMSKLLEAS
jgi:hypothetical protein